MDSAGGFVALAAAEGNTKKAAQQEAARLAFASLVSGTLLEALPKREASGAGGTGNGKRTAEAPAVAR